MIQNEHIDMLIALYLQGASTHDQTRELQNWISQSDANKSYYLQMESAFFMAPQTKQDFNSQLAWEKVSAELQPKKGKIVSLKVWSYWAAAVAAALVIGVFWVNSHSSTQIAFASTQEVLVQQLPNGVDMTLNKNSSATWEESNTEVWVNLKGEAYFDVKSHGTKTFLVKTKELVIKDIGTAFLVRNNEYLDSVFFQVNDGTIVCYAQNGDSLKLEKGESGFFTKSNSRFGKRAPKRNESAYATHKFIYNEANIGEVIADMQMQFGTAIQVTDNAMLDCTISVVFDNQSLSEIVDVLAVTMGWQAEFQEGVWKLAGPSCQTPS